MKQCFIWDIPSGRKFNDLLLSWNAKRPKRGSYIFYIAVKVENWSAWIKYASWGAAYQTSFNTNNTSYTKHVQDRVETDKPYASGFKIKVLAEGGADLEDIDALHVCISKLDDFQTIHPFSTLKSTFIENVPQQSQMNLNHPRYRDLCSPTSTSSVVNYLSNVKVSDPVEFASLVRDESYDIYGNWILNIAQAYHFLQGKWYCYVKRLKDFSELHSHLLQKIPVIVSIKGKLHNAPKPYNKGHLIIVIGWDNDHHHVVCIDPAFSKNEKTLTRYNLKDFLKAWGERKNLSYLFFPISKHVPNLPSSNYPLQNNR